MSSALLLSVVNFSFLNQSLLFYNRLLYVINETFDASVENSFVKIYHSLFNSDALCLLYSNIFFASTNKKKEIVKKNKRNESN